MKSKNYQWLFIGLTILLSIIIVIIFFINDKQTPYPTKDFNKIFIPNTKTYTTIQEYIDKMLYQYDGVDRINIFSFHNGSEDIRQIPFLKESIQMKSMKDERLDITDLFTNYPIPHDLFKINYLYENSILVIDSNKSMIPKSFKAQLDKFKINNAVYHILVSETDGIPFGYISIENVSSKRFHFNSADSTKFVKDVLEIEAIYNKLQKENKSNYSYTGMIVLIIGFTGLVLLLVIIGFFTNSKNIDTKFDDLIDFMKPKMEAIVDDMTMFTIDISKIHNRLKGIEESNFNTKETMNIISDNDKVYDDITIRFAELIKEYSTNIDDYTSKKLLYKCGIRIAKFYISVFHYYIKPKTYKINNELPTLMFEELCSSIRDILTIENIIIRQADIDKMHSNNEELFRYLKTLNENESIRSNMLDNYNTILSSNYLILMEQFKAIILNRKKGA